jgi:hypothetical protein
VQSASDISSVHAKFGDRVIRRLAGVGRPRWLVCMTYSDMLFGRMVAGNPRCCDSLASSSGVSLGIKRIAVRDLWHTLSPRIFSHLDVPYNLVRDFGGFFFCNLTLCSLSEILSLEDDV